MAIQAKEWAGGERGASADVTASDAEEAKRRRRGEGDETTGTMLDLAGHDCLAPARAVAQHISADDAQDMIWTVLRPADALGEVL